MFNYKDIGLVNTRDMFAKAMKGKYAIPAYNFNNMEQMQAIIQACVETKSPVILQVSKGARAYADKYILRNMARGAVEYAHELGCDIPIVLHLDHGPSFEVAKDCIDNGFSSVMIDGSALPYDQNVAVTKQVVDYAHKYDVTETGCDSLAISIGTSHGRCKFTPEQCTRSPDGVLIPPPLAFDVLEAIEKKLPGFPIVLHGSSSVPMEYVRIIEEFGGKIPDSVGIPEEQLRKASKSAVCKINIDSDGRLAMTAAIRKFFAEHPDKFDPREYLGPAREELKKMYMHKNIEVLGSAGHALD